MTIDTSKIRPGDTGTIRVRFEGSVIKLEEDEILVCVGSHSIYVPASSIASHTPAPWAPKQGDVVRWHSEREWTVVAFDSNEAWISTTGCNGRIAKLSDLTLIRKGAA